MNSPITHEDIKDLRRLDELEKESLIEGSLSIQKSEERERLRERFRLVDKNLMLFKFIDKILAENEQLMREDYWQSRAIIAENTIKDIRRQIAELMK